MREIVKGWISVLIHFIIGFCCCLVYVFSFAKPAVLSQFLITWKFAEAGLLFIRFIPALLISAILIGYAIIFGTCGQNTVQRYSQILLRYLRDAFIILFFCITAYILATEIVSPLLIRYKQYTEIRTHDYHDLIKETDIALKNSLVEEAYISVKAALGIWKDSSEALQLLDTVKVLRVTNDTEQKKMTVSLMESSTAAAENLTPESALYISKRYMDINDFYTAHFYAMKSYNISSQNAPSREEAMLLAAQAWDKIEKGAAELTADFDIRLYQKKKAGYKMMQQGNYIQAYYQFSDTQRMIEEHSPLKQDPDIDRFVAITKEKLLEEVFFIDEIEMLSLYESVRHITFTIPASAKEAKTMVKIDSISFVSVGSMYEIYGRNCEITQYDTNDKVILKYYVPFVKFIPILTENNQSLMRMQLQAVDRKNADVALHPTVVEGVLPADRLPSRFLPFSFNDFELIIAACEGEKTMTLPQLYSFQSKSLEYGFSKKIYHREILVRISDTLLILIISVYMLILAWRFRIPPHQEFKEYWVFTFPVFFAAVSIIVETSRYCSYLLITFLIDTMYVFSSVVILFIYILLFISVSFCFFAQRSDL